jgi:hypothetical protein
MSDDLLYLQAAAAAWTPASSTGRATAGTATSAASLMRSLLGRNLAVSSSRCSRFSSSSSSQSLPHRSAAAAASSRATPPGRQHPVRTAAAQVCVVKLNDVSGFSNRVMCITGCSTLHMLSVMWVRRQPSKPAGLALSVETVSSPSHRQSCHGGKACAHVSATYLKCVVIESKAGVSMPFHALLQALTMAKLLPFHPEQPHSSSQSSSHHHPRHLLRLSGSHLQTTSRQGLLQLTSRPSCPVRSQQLQHL